MSRFYHDTTHAPADQLGLFEGKARSLAARVLMFLRKEQGARSPSEVHAAICGPDRPLTSTRSAMTNLTTWGFLEKTTTKREGLYGRLEYTWRARADAGSRNGGRDHG